MTLANSGLMSSVISSDGTSGGSTGDRGNHAPQKFS